MTGCELSFKRRNALFWTIVNITCILTVPGILSFTSFAGQNVKVIVSMYFLLNLCMHLYTIFRKPKLNQEKTTNLRNNYGKSECNWTSPYLSSKSNEIKVSLNNVEPSFEDIEAESISCFYEFEIGVLITPNGVAIKSCKCPILNRKCRLCPFRVFPLEDFKTWFWHTSKLYSDICKLCGTSFLVDEREYAMLLRTRYPYHYCKCHCKYCNFAMKHPLQSRVNLIPDEMHCTCICRQCRSIEDIIHGLQPLQEAAFYNFSEVVHSAHIDSEIQNFSWIPQQSFNQEKVRAPLTLPSSSHSAGGDHRHFQFQTELWSHFKVNPYYLISWITNLRTWISNTIVKRIVAEIDNIDHILHSQGLTSISVGAVGLDVLKAVASSVEVADAVPTLAQILPFLEVSLSQEYVVQRIRELSIGNIMVHFAGLTGGSCGPLSWSQRLPSDAELVMHMVVTYLDLMLPLLRNEPRRRPFSTLYFVRAPNVPSQNDISIYTDNTFPTYYQLVINEKLIEVPSGFNNVFFTLLLFIHYIKISHQGVLGKVNLGPSGLNMLYIVDESTRN